MSIIRADSLKDRAGVGAPSAPHGMNVTGVCTATTFSGSGASLTNLDASDLASGTIPDARFPATLPAVSGANLTNVSAGKLLQIVQQHDTTFTRAAVNSTTFTATTHQVSITPTAANSKIYVTISGVSNNNGQAQVMYMTILRSIAGGSFNNIVPHGSSGANYGLGYNKGDQSRNEISFAMHYLDDPTYTLGQAIIYRLYIRAGGGYTVEVPSSPNAEPVLCIAQEIAA